MGNGEGDDAGTRGRGDAERERNGGNGGMEKEMTRGRGDAGTRRGEAGGE
ncbi:MAG: hypothetical protein SWY16_00380 [Cyanobacteriota bacterium]|nr:hypothetical protein [Cyanobacteriota bacterium]